MKRTVKLFALALALILLVGLFASCDLLNPFGKRLSGVYTSPDGYSYTFEGNRFTSKVGTVTMKGTYEIKQIDEDYVIFLTIETQKVGDGKEKEHHEVLGGENGLEFIQRETEDGTRYIKIHETFYYEVKN